MSSWTASQIMKPYRRGTVMSWRWLRRLTYGRGHGIHSPRAFSIVHSWLRPYGIYYDDLTSPLDPASVPLLWYRIMARLRPSMVLYRLSDPKTEHQLQQMQHRAVQRMHPGGERVMVTDQISEANDFILRSTEAEAVVLLLEVRRDPERERQFLHYLTHSQHRGIVLDLFDCAILLNNNHELYYYRTSL